MKKYLFMSLILSAALLAGCSDDDPIEVSNVSLDETTLQLLPGESMQLTATVTPDDAENKTITWTSSNPDAATVSEEGLVVAVAPGVTVIAAASGSKAATCEVTVAYPVETVFIPAGSFMMGSPESEPNRHPMETQHPVTLTKDFHMGKYQVTNAQYAEFLNSTEIEVYEVSGYWIAAGKVTYNKNGEAVTDEKQDFIYSSDGPYLNDTGLNWDEATSTWTPAPGKEDSPMTWVSWYGAVAYANWIGGSLPTEAQWEYACRGDYANKATETNTLPFGIGTGRKLTGDMANFYTSAPYDLDGETPGWYEDESAIDLYKQSTTPVGYYSDYANSYGLYDMHGNVNEWCLDQWNVNDNYLDLDATDPLSTAGSMQVIRGSFWSAYAMYCRSASRGNASANSVDASLGFRVIFYP